jgi:hypothetical protein
MALAKQSEPPSAEDGAPAHIFLVGRDSHGHWVVQDERGLCGGLFVDRNKAIRFAMGETGKRPQAIRLVPGILELDMSRTARAASPPPPADLDARREIMATLARIEESCPDYLVADAPHRVARAAAE